MSTSFLPISPCCIKGSVLNGTPRGEFQAPGSAPDVVLGRYIVHPEGKNADPKAALVLFYDVFGFQLPNPKILADAFADRLGVTVVVPDYMPAGLPPDYLSSAMEAYPGQKAGQGMISSFFGKLSLLKVIPYAGGIRDGAVNPKVEQAVTDLRKAGYERLVAVGYCRGGSVIAHLLSKGDEAGLDAGVLIHPGVEADRWAKFTKPSLWLLSDPAHEHFFKEEQVDKLKATFKESGAPFEVKIYPDTAHGFGARPTPTHEPTMAAFNDANERAGDFAKKYLGL